MVGIAGYCVDGITGIVWSVSQGIVWTVIRYHRYCVVGILQGSAYSKMQGFHVWIALQGFVYGSHCRVSCMDRTAGFRVWIALQGLSAAN